MESSSGEARAKDLRVLRGGVLIIGPVVIRQIPDQEVGVLEIVLGPSLEDVKKIQHTLMVVVVVGSLIVVAGHDASEDTLMVMDLELDESEQLLQMPGKLFEGYGLRERLHGCAWMTVAYSDGSLTGLGSCQVLSCVY